MTVEYPSLGESSYPGPRPSTHLVWAIIATLFCCLPFGIVAIVKAAQVDSLWFQGRYREAHAASRSAKLWVMWSILPFVVLGVALVIGAILTSIFGEVPAQR